jgi:hypothetical protein
MNGEGKAGAKIVSQPADKPWRLREFRVADLDDNQLRVFYDFSPELSQEQRDFVVRGALLKFCYRDRLQVRPKASRLPSQPNNARY